jgi:hypothetical protein
VRIDIPGDVELTMVSPLKERINTYSMPFDIWASPEIDILFGRAGNINARDNKIREISGLMVLDIVRMCGMLRVLKDSDGIYSCTFTGQNSINYSLGSIKLTDIDFGTADCSDFFDIGYDSIDDHYISIGPDIALCFPPVTNYKAFDNFPFVYPNYMINAVGYLYPPNLSSIYWSDGYDFAPAISVSYALKKIAQAFGINLTENILTGIPWTKLFFMTNKLVTEISFTDILDNNVIFSITKIVVEETKVTLTVQSGDMVRILVNDCMKMYNLTISKKRNFEGRIVQITDIDRDENTISFEMEEGELENAEGSLGNIRLMNRHVVPILTFELADCMPDLTCLEFIEAIEGQTGSLFIHDEMSRDARLVSLDNIILDNDYTDVTQYAGQISEKNLTEETGFSLSYEGEDDEYFSDRVKELNENHTLKDPVAVISDLPLSDNEDGDVRLVTDQNILYVWNSYNYGSRQLNETTSVYLGSWIKFSENFMKLTSGDGSFPVEIKSRPLITGNIHPFSYGFTTPRLDKPFNHLITKVKTNIGVRTLFLEELVNGYPLPKSENDDISLSISGPIGIYEKLYKNYLHWRIDRYREAQTKIHWPYHLFTSFKWDKKYRINGTDYFIMDMKLSQKGSGPIRFGEATIARV